MAAAPVMRRQALPPAATANVAGDIRLWIKATAAILAAVMAVKAIFAMLANNPFK